MVQKAHKGTSTQSYNAIFAVQCQRPVIHNYFLLNKDGEIEQSSSLGVENNHLSYREV